MKKLVGLLLVLPVFIFVSCFQCRAPSVESRIQFDGLDSIGIKMVSTSRFRDSISNEVRSIYSLETGGLVYPQKLSGTEILKAYYQSYPEWHYFQWIDEKGDIVLVWDLSDTSERWCCESNWCVDTSVCPVCSETRYKTIYTNRYVFTEADTD